MALSRSRRSRSRLPVGLVALLGLALLAPLHLPASAAPLPDLRVTTQDVTSRSVAAGSSLGVDTTVRNAGRKKAGRSLLRWYLSGDGSWSKGDVALGKRRVPRLAPGAVSRKSVQLVVPASTAARRYFVIACADAKDAVTESREGNNCRPTGTKVKVTTQDGTFPLEPDPLSVDSTLQTERAVTTLALAAPMKDMSTTLSTTAADGTKYTLEIPYRALLTPEEITMTPVASVDGLPMSGGLVAGVQIEPHGLMLQEPATLTIESPDAGALAAQTGFIFDGNGDDFHLYPMAPPETGDDKDVIRMSLTHFSTPGVGSATNADRAEVRSHPPVSSQAQLEQEVSDLLRGERQDQLNGEPPDPSVNEQVVALQNAYFDHVLRGRMQAAEGNADIGPQTIAEALSWVRQMLLLRVDAESPRIREAMNRIEKIAKNMMNTYWSRCTTEHDLGAAVGLVGLARQALLIGWPWGEEAADKAERCGNFEVRFDSVITFQSGHSGEMSVGQTEGRWGVESTAEIPWTGFGDGALTYTEFAFRDWTDYPWDDCGHYSDTVGTTTQPGRLTGLVGVRANPWDPPVGRPLPPVVHLRVVPGTDYEDFSFSEAHPTETYHTETCSGQSYDETESRWQSQFESLHPGALEWDLTAVKDEVLFTESWDRSIPHDGGATTEKTTIELWHKPLP